MIHISPEHKNTLRFVLEGKTVKEIAVEIGKSVDTVRSHIYSLHIIFQVTNQIHLFCRAIELGIVEVTPENNIIIHL